MKDIAIAGRACAVEYVWASTPVFADLRPRCQPVGTFQDRDQYTGMKFLCRDMGVRVEYAAGAFAKDGSLPSSILKHFKRVMAAFTSAKVSRRCRKGL